MSNSLNLILYNHKIYRQTYYHYDMIVFRIKAHVVSAQLPSPLLLCQDKRALEIAALIDLQERCRRRRQIANRKPAWNHFYHHVIAQSENGRWLLVVAHCTRM